MKYAILLMCCMGVVLGSGDINIQASMSTVETDFTEQLNKWQTVFEKFCENNKIQNIRLSTEVYNPLLGIYTYFTLQSELVNWRQTICSENIANTQTITMNSYKILLYKSQESENRWATACIFWPNYNSDNDNMLNLSLLKSILEKSLTLPNHSKLVFMLLANAIIQKIVTNTKNRLRFTNNQKLDFMTWINKKLAELDANEQKPHN